MQQQLANWRKSSRSGTHGGACVEVGSAPGVVGVRDTKDRAAGAVVVSREVWSRFVEAVKVGRFPA